MIKKIIALRRLNKEEKLKYELKKILDKQASCQFSINDLTLMIDEINPQSVIFDLQIDAKILEQKIRRKNVITWQ